MTDPAAPDCVFCVLGWHFHRPVLEQLAGIARGVVYILSHRPAGDVPGFVSGLIQADHIITRPNIGYDWGGYQQFLETGVWRNYRYVFFLHDDLIISDTGFVERCIGMLEDGRKVIGNGLIRQDHWPQSRVECYAHASWGPPPTKWRHRVIRGSFIATKRESLEILNGFDVFWDRFRLSIGFGNWSLVATCGKMQRVFGSEFVGYLGDSYGVSPYVTELQAGGISEEENRRRRRRSSVLAAIFKMCARAYVWCRRSPWRMPLGVFPGLPVWLLSSRRRGVVGCRTVIPDPSVHGCVEPCRRTRSG
jgi:hypothetical protein